MISVQQVSKAFGSQQVLRNLSINFEHGKTTAIVGPSGVGKSVLLKIIMGILPPDQGDILIGGRSIVAARGEREKNDIRADLGVLFQAAALFDSLTIYDNVAFPLRERLHLPPDEVHSRVSEMLASLSLTRFASRFPQEVSIGIRKRAGLARAVITRPKFVLFDEPNTGLDPLVGQEVYDLINLSRKRWGFTGIVISHELPEVFQVSDYVVMLYQGALVCEGTPQEFAASESPIVQQFLRGSIDGPIRIQ